MHVVVEVKAERERGQRQQGGDQRELQRQLRAIPEVHHVALVGGSFDVIMLVRAANNEALRRVVFEVLQALPEVVDTQTHLIFEDGAS